MKKMSKYNAYMAKEHRVSIGSMMIRLSWSGPVGPTSQLFRYDTMAWHAEIDLKKRGIEVTCDTVAWDGETDVIWSNGD